MHYFSNLF